MTNFVYTIGNASEIVRINGLDTYDEGLGEGANGCTVFEDSPTGLPCESTL